MTSIRGRLLSERLSVLRLIGLLGSGGISALALIVLASQRIPWLTGDRVTSVLLFLQWQTLALTLCKLGVDQVAFAVQSKQASVRVDLSGFWRGLPAALLLPSAIVIGFLFGPWAAAAMLISVPCDIASLLFSAELNARKTFLPVVISNFLNYPVFMTLFLVGGYWIRGGWFPFVCFALSSLVRLLWLIRPHRVVTKDAQPSRFGGEAWMIGQQTLNYLVCRSDQLILPVLSLVIVVSTIQQDRFVFFFKYPDLSATVTNAVGLLVFPMLSYEVSRSGRLKIFVPRPFLAVSVGLAMLYAGGMLIYQRLDPASAHRLDWYWYHLFALDAILMWLAASLTYCYLGGGYVGTLVRNSVVATLAGGMVIAWVTLSGHANALAFLIPCQLLVFSGLCLFTPVGVARHVL